MGAQQVEASISVVQERLLEAQPRLAQPHALPPDLAEAAPCRSRRLDWTARSACVLFCLNLALVAPRAQAEAAELAVLTAPARALVRPQPVVRMTRLDRAAVAEAGVKHWKPGAAERNTHPQG